MAAKSPAAGEIAALFQLPLKDFTSARDALAARLKRDGATADAAAVKALAKPTLSAWVVNQLYWGERPRFDELLSAVADLRAAQRARGDLRGPLEVRRQALAALTRSATARLRDAGGNPAPELLRRVAGTLEALATLGGAAGQLSRDLDPPGFEALAGFPRAASVAAGGGKDRKVLPFARPAAKGERRGGGDKDRDRERQAAEERAAARRVVQEAEAELRAAQAGAKRAEAAAAAGRERAQAAQLEKDKLERLLAEAAGKAKNQAAEARKLERESKSASLAVAEAEQRLKRARQKLEE